MMLSRASRVRLSSVARSLVLLGVMLSMVLASIVPAYAAGGLTGNLSGTVQDTSGKPVAGASVTLAGPSGSYKQTSNGSGRFNFLNVAVDTYTISVEAQGFDPVSQSGITITGDATNELGNVRLSPTTKLKNIASVRARSSSSVFQPSQTIPQFTVSGSVLEDAQGKQASASETNVLLAAPGFQKDNMGNLILNGSTTDEVHFFFDGVDFTDPGFNRNGNNYFLNGISSTQIVSGAGDPSQGNSGAGSVNLVVKRGTYPGSGLLDLEALSRPFDHQLNFQYGIATRNNSVSDYFSYFKVDNAIQYGPWGSSIYSNSVNNNPFYGSEAYSQTSDFVNNFVVRFGKNNNQSLQALYYSDSTQTYNDVAGVPITYDNLNPDVLGIVQGITAYTNPTTGVTSTLPLNVISGLIRPEPGEGRGSQSEVCCGSSNLATQPDQVGQTTLLKFEYDNQFNATTALALRYFNSNIEASSFNSAGTLTNFANAVPLAGQQAGGSRTGGIFELTEQANAQNLLTLSGEVEDSRPNFATNFGQTGIESLGPNAALFIRPGNPNAPVSATNPCPVSAAVFPGACFLQQYYYKDGGTPYYPGLNLDSFNLEKEYGVGIRDQIQVNSRLRLDLGARYDIINEGFGPNLFYEDENVQAVPGSPSTFYVQNYNFAETPHFIEPRVGFSYKISNNDSTAFTYGKSINETGSGEQASPNNFAPFAQFQNIPNTAALAAAWTQNPALYGPAPSPADCYPTVPFAVGATATSQPSYKGSVGKNLQLGKPCANLAQLLYFQNDSYFPEVIGVQPAVFENYDFNYSHLFKDGSSLRIAPFFRQGSKIQIETAPLVYNPATGVYSFGSIVGQPDGKNTTTGIDLSYVLPDRPFGFTGFVTATYVNEFTNTPPAGDNPYGQDFEPLVLPQSYSTGSLYRAGFVSPVTLNIGAAYKTKGGIRVNPVLHFNSGFPYNAGSLTAYQSNVYGAIIVPNTNLTDQYGAGGAPSYVDPANPGTTGKPIISATRGQAETPSGGGLLSRPQITADLTLEYSPPHSRSTFGFQIQDLFDNEYFGLPTVNQNYYPVVSGVAAPLTGQSITGASYPGLAAITAKNTLPYSAYSIPASGIAPTNFRLYYQLAL